MKKSTPFLFCPPFFRAVPAAVQTLVSYAFPTLEYEQLMEKSQNQKQKPKTKLGQEEQQPDAKGCGGRALKHTALDHRSLRAAPRIVAIRRLLEVVMTAHAAWVVARASTSATTGASRAL